MYSEHGTPNDEQPRCFKRGQGTWLGAAAVTAVRDTAFGAQPAVAAGGRATALRRHSATRECIVRVGSVAVDILDASALTAIWGRLTDPTLGFSALRLASQSEFRIAIG